MTRPGVLKRRNISLTEEEEARLLAAIKRETRPGNFSQWLVGLGYDRADKLGVAKKPPFDLDHDEASPTPPVRAPKKQTKKTKRG